MQFGQVYIAVESFAEFFSLISKVHFSDYFKTQLTLCGVKNELSLPR